MVKLKTLDEATTEDILNGTAAPAIQIRGKIGYGSGFGFARRGDGRFGENRGPGGVYQRRYTGYNQHGYIPGKKRVPYYIRMRKYRPTNPRTVEQQGNRNKFREAVEAWQLMPEEEKIVWKTRAVRKSRRGRNVFIQWFMLQSDT